MAVRRRQERRATAAQWAAVNPVLAAGEIGVEIANPADSAAPKQKIGDGLTAWTDLDYSAGGGLVRDTGWRSIVLDGGSNDDVGAYIRRVGDLVEIASPYQEDVPGAAAGLQLPVGFTNARNVALSTHLGLDDNSPIDDEQNNYALVDPQGFLSVYKGAGYGSFRLSYLTDDPFPTTGLPGTALTPASMSGGVAVSGGGDGRDSGWRYLGDLMSSPGNTEEFTLFAWVRRVGSEIECLFNSRKLPDDYSGSAYLPDGFKPYLPDVSTVPGDVTVNSMAFSVPARIWPSGANTPIYQLVGPDGDVGAFYDIGPVATGPWRLLGHQIKFATRDAWPSVLPGVAADPT